MDTQYIRDMIQQIEKDLFPDITDDGDSNDSDITMKSILKRDRESGEEPVIKHRKNDGNES